MTSNYLTEVRQPGVMRQPTDESSGDSIPRVGRLEFVAGIIETIVFAGLLAVMFLAAAVYGTVDAWWEAAFECCVFALTALWIIEGALRGHWHFRRAAVLLPLAVIAIYVFFQILPWPISSSPRGLSIDRYQTYLTAVKTLALTLFVGLLLVHTHNTKRLRWVVRAVVGLGVASAAFGILRQFFQSPDSTTGFGLTFLFYQVGYGQFISPNAFAYLMEMTFGVLVGLMLGGGIPRNRVLLYVALTAIVFSALVLSNSRAGILSLISQILLVLLISFSWFSVRANDDEDSPRWIRVVRKSMVTRVVIIGALLLTIGVAVSWLGGELLSNKLIGLTPALNERTQDDPTRREIWRASWQLFKDHPWTGVGYGTYFLAIPQYEHNSGRVKLEQAHNDYLDLAAAGGIVGLALAAWFIVAIVRKSRESFRASDRYERAAALGAASGLLGVAIHSLLDFGLQMTGLAVVFGALIVILLAPRSRRRRHRRRRSLDTIRSA